MAKDKTPNLFKTLAARNKAAKAVLTAREKLAKAADVLNAKTDLEPVSAETAYDKAMQKLGMAEDVYIDGLPELALSRCPFTGKVFNLSIDNFGLDGPWWDSDQPVRQSLILPDTVFALTGSVALGKILPECSFRIKSGAVVPTIVARLLVNPEIKAVISSLKIGNFDAYAITYFAEFPPLDIARVNLWGTRHYITENQFGEGYSCTIPDQPLDYDSDLEFYIRTGRLMWIAPNDKSMTLRATLSDCPYIGLSGSPQPVAVQNGKMWSTMAESSTGQPQPLSA